MRDLLKLASGPRLIRPKVRFWSEVAEGIAQEVHQFPMVEVGGKFVGRVSVPKRLEGPRDLDNLTCRSYTISMPADPTHTATYHLPDGASQERLFRKIEAHHPEVEHLGTWPPSPQRAWRISSGDINGYFKDVNSPHYNLEVFLASLVVDRSGLVRARHFLFVRDLFRVFEIAPDRNRLIE